jgi:hypothetical protein
VDYAKKLKINGNITNLADIKGVSTISVTSPSGYFPRPLSGARPAPVALL